MSIFPQGSCFQKWRSRPDAISLDLDPLLHSGKEAWLFCRTSSSVRLYWELEEPKGPKGGGPGRLAWRGSRWRTRTGGSARAGRRSRCRSSSACRSPRAAHAPSRCQSTAIRATLLIERFAGKLATTQTKGRWEIGAWYQISRKWTYTDPIYHFPVTNFSVHRSSCGPTVSAVWRRVTWSGLSSLALPDLHCAPHRVHSDQDSAQTLQYKKHRLSARWGSRGSLLQFFHMTEFAPQKALKLNA